MQLREFYKIAEEYAPKGLSDEFCARYGAYDNSGILVDTGKEIKGALFSLDFSLAAIAKAEESGTNLLVTHHPAIYAKTGKIAADDLSGGKLIRCIEKGISVVSMHLNLDLAAGGIDESMMLGIRAAAGERIAETDEGCGDEKIMQPVAIGSAKGGYGRAYGLKETSFGSLCEGIGKIFGTKRLLTYGDENRTIRRAASFCGAGADENALDFAVENDADAIVSADVKHHIVTAAVERGLCAIVLTHYASENYGFEKYYQKISRQAGVPCLFFTDKILL